MNKPTVGQLFFLCVVNGNADGTIGSEYLEKVRDNPEVLEDYARELAEQYGSTSFIYRCEAIAKIEPLPKSKVTPLGRQP